MSKGKNYSLYLTASVSELLEFESKKKGLTAGAYIKSLIEKDLGLVADAEDIAQMKRKIASLENEQRRMRYESIHTITNTEVLSDFALVGTHLKKIN